MLVLEGAGATSRPHGRLAPLSRIGFAVLIAGFFIDVVTHVLGATGPAMDIGHLVTLGGMVLALAGLFRVAWRGGTAPDGRRRA